MLAHLARKPYVTYIAHFVIGFPGWFLGGRAVRQQAHLLRGLLHASSLPAALALEERNRKDACMQACLLLPLPCIPQRCSPGCIPSLLLLRPPAVAVIGFPLLARLVSGGGASSGASTPAGAKAKPGARRGGKKVRPAGRSSRPLIEVVCCTADEHAAAMQLRQNSAAGGAMPSKLRCSAGC